ncbi:MAG: acyl-[acyl-carrier-protein]--UDP-N-acetylglucosamine O-acyltransferase [Blastocatellia bacterium]|nr:MAG: acyl-[acyl-carrier-protein]--UDP-N-acetylglucosamine O-acyltransferase [Blastocatellia bacterium]
MTSVVAPTAFVSTRAQIGTNVSIGPYAVVEDDTIIGDNCKIGAHAVIKRYTHLGPRNRVYEHTVLGGEPQDVKFRDEASRLVIGEENLIREFCTLHRASGEDKETRIGSRNFLMVGVHVAHNCEIGDDNIFANGAALAGHITVEDHVFLSNNVGAHQFVRMGRYAMVGGKSKIVQDVLPFLITDGNPPRVRGVNSVGLRRGGFDAEARLNIKRAYHILFRSALPLEEALTAITNLDDANTQHLIDFIRGSTRGFTRSKRREGDLAETPLGNPLGQHGV